jgi:hypothetical protein
MRLLAKILLVLLVVAVLAAFGLKKNVSTGGMSVRETAHFAIHHQQIDPDTLDELAQHLETHVERINGFFNIDESEKSTVIVYRDVGSFQRAYLGHILSVFFGDWAAGAAYGETLLLTSPNNPGSTHGHDDLLDIAVHEYIHTCIYRLNERADIWLDEGLATHLSGQDTLPTTDPPSFEAMQSQSMGTFLENDGYAFACAYVEHLIETYGRPSVIDLVITNDFERSLGRSHRDAYDGWIAALDTTDDDQ